MRAIHTLELFVAKRSEPDRCNFFRTLQKSRSRLPIRKILAALGIIHFSIATFHLDDKTLDRSATDIRYFVQHRKLSPALVSSSLDIETVFLSSPGVDERM